MFYPGGRGSGGGEFMSKKPRINPTLYLESLYMQLLRGGI